MPTREGARNNGSGQIRKDSGSFSDHGNRSLPNSAVHKPVPGRDGKGGKSK